MTLTELNLWRTTLQFLAVRCTSTCARQFAIVSALLGLSLAAQATEPNLPMAMPGWNLVAIDTPTQTYIDYVNVPRSGKWEFAWPMLAKWESQKTYTAVRFQPFTVRAQRTLTVAQIFAFLPATKRARRIINIKTYGATTTRDATDAIQNALDAAGEEARENSPVDVLVPAGTYTHNDLLTVPPYVRLRGYPEDAGGTLKATNSNESAVHLDGNGSGVLFLKLTSTATVRGSTPDQALIEVGDAWNGVYTTSNILIVGNTLTGGNAAVNAGVEYHGLYAFNLATGALADSFYHTFGSSYGQVIGNIATNGGDDFYSFDGYVGEVNGIVHHFAAIANYGDTTASDGVCACGVAYLTVQNNHFSHAQGAGISIYQNGGMNMFGDLYVYATNNTLSDKAFHQANGWAYDGIWVESDNPSGSNISNVFGTVQNTHQKLFINDNAISSTHINANGGGHGIGLYNCNNVTVDNNTLTDNQASPQLNISGCTDVTESDNAVN